MSLVEAPVRKKETPSKTVVNCYHCGEACDNSIREDDHFFCCEGCQFVYGLLKENGLCDYYDLSSTPGIKVRGKYSSDKFLFLDTAEVEQKLLSFKDEKQSQVSFYLPQMHCASCIWLLENLHAIQPGILFFQNQFSTERNFYCLQSPGDFVAKSGRTAGVYWLRALPQPQ